MSLLRFGGDGFSQYYVEHILLDGAKLRESFPVDEARYKELRSVLRNGRRTLAHRSEARSVRTLLLEPLRQHFGWELGNDAPIETMRGTEEAGIELLNANGELWARALCVAPDESFDIARQGSHRRFAAAPRLVRALEAQNLTWGILLNASELRIVNRAEGQIASCLAFDLIELAEYGDHGRRVARILSGLLSRESLERHPRILDEVVTRGRAESVGVGKQLGRQVLEAIVTLVAGLYADPTNQELLPRASDEPGLANLYGEALRILYRVLFILYAEARGLLPVDTPIYRDSYALRGKRPNLGEGERLKALFRLLRRGADLGAGERIPAYGGELFSESAAPMIESLRWSDSAVAEMLRKLTFVQSRRGLQPLSYRELDIEQIGSIYEGLLELTLAIAPEPLIRVQLDHRELALDERAVAELVRRRGVVADDDLLESATEEIDDAAEDVDDDLEDDDNDETPSRVGKPVRIIGRIEPGTPYLKSWLGRKQSASYYTKRALVEFLVRKTIDPLAADATPDRILKLRVVDPAMGSGHFLVGAMRRLAEHLFDAYARIVEEHGEDGLPPLLAPIWHDEIRAMDICRQLVSVRCLYGVDRNPLAVDLARVSLWLATAAHDHPLSFLDHRLRCGDSLLGISMPQVITTADLTAKPKRSKKKEQAQFQMLMLGGELVDEIALERALDEALRRAFGVLSVFLELLDDETRPFEAQRDGFAAVLRVLEPLRILHDARIGRLWCDEENAQPLLEALREFSTMHLVQSSLAGIQSWVQTARERRAFCWELEFPDAYFERIDNETVRRRADAGFDIAIGNPPWDKTKISEKEFYVRYDPLILETQGRKQTGTLIKAINACVPGASEGWKRAQDEAKRYPILLGDTGLYNAQTAVVGKKRTGGDADLYKFFAERFYWLLCDGGRCGIVIPGAFTSNDGSTGIRRLLFNHAQIESIVVFENRQKLFDIDSRFKFQVMSYIKGGRTEAFEAAFWQHDTSVLEVARDGYNGVMFLLRADDVRRFSPERLQLLEYRSGADERLAKMMIEAAPPLSAKLDDTWNVKFVRELDMTNDSKLFQTRSELERLGAQRTGDEWTSHTGERFIPLFVGRMVQAFDNNPKRYVSGAGRSAVWDENGWPKKPLEPQYWVPNSALSPEHRDLPIRLCWSDVTGATNERTAMAALLPNSTVSGHTLYVALQFPKSTDAAWSFLSLFNSFVVDFFCRLSVATHMSLPYVAPLPFVRSYSPAVTHQMVLLREDATYAERADARAEIDAGVALTYGFSLADLEHVLSTFPLLDREEPRLEGEPKSTITRDLVLAAYCRQASVPDVVGYADRAHAARTLGAFGYVSRDLRKAIKEGRV